VLVNSTFSQQIYEAQRGVEMEKQHNQKASLRNFLKFRAGWRASKTLRKIEVGKKFFCFKTKKALFLFNLLLLFF